MALARCLTLVCAATLLPVCSTGHIRSDPDRTSPTPSVISFTDPRELASYYARNASSGNWPALQPILPEEDQDLRIGPGRTDLNPLFGPGTTIGQSPEDWTIEPRATGFAARLEAWVVPIRRLTDGSLRLDPNPCAIYRARQWRDHPDATLLGDGSYTRTVRGVDAVALQAAVRDSAVCMVTTDAGIEVSINWMLLGSHVTIPVSGLSWSAGDQRGAVRVVWTTAVVANEDLELAFPSGPPVDGSTAYYLDTTFLLEGARLGTGARFQLSGITVTPAGAAPFGVDLEYEMPEQPFPQPVV